MKAIDDVIAERTRQIDAEGWTTDHDDDHEEGDLAQAGACYALEIGIVKGPLRENGTPVGWPFEASWWKPKNDRRNLVRSAALIIAEIERIDRSEDRKDLEFKMRAKAHREKQLIENADAIHSIVQGLRKLDTVHVDRDTDEYRCTLCQAKTENYVSLPEEHSIACPWRLARELP